MWLHRRANRLLSAGVTPPGRDVSVGDGEFHDEGLALDLGARKCLGERSATFITSRLKPENRRSRYVSTTTAALKGQDASIQQPADVWR
jgi:hypothetical protein